MPTLSIGKDVWSDVGFGDAVTRGPQDMKYSVVAELATFFI